MAKDDSPIARAFRDEGLEVIPRAFKRSGQFADFARCVRDFRELKPALVGTHSNIDSRVALAAAAAAGVARRVRYRHVSIPVRVSPWNRLIYRRFATHVVTTARSIADDLAGDFSLPPDAVRSIPTGVSPAADAGDARREVKEKLGLPAGARIVTQVSVLRSWKGHAYLIGAFHRLAKAHPDLHLVLVGTGSMLEPLTAQVASLSLDGRVHFAGHQADPYPFFMAADVVALASTGGEGVPQSVLQCFACARPFVGTTVGGIPDIVRHGRNGLLVPPADADALASGIREILDDETLASALAANARQSFLDTGTVDHMGATLRGFLGL